MIQKRKGMNLIPAGHLQQFKLCLKGYFFFIHGHFNEALRIYTKSIQLNRNSSNTLRLSALKKIEKLLNNKSQKANYQGLQNVRKQQKGETPASL